MKTLALILILCAPNAFAWDVEMDRSYLNFSSGAYEQAPPNPNLYGAYGTPVDNSAYYTNLHNEMNTDYNREMQYQQTQRAVQNQLDEMSPAERLGGY